MISIGLHDPKKELNLGSYRIYINDLNYYFTQNNINSKIGDETSDVLIYSKSSFPKKIYGKLIGTVNPNSDDIKKLKSCDFAIVGSVEEKESIISHMRNVFVFPQIEKMYMNVTPKVHLEKDEIVIGYHGNPNHLNHLDLGLTNALSRLYKTHKIKLLVIKSSISPISDWIGEKPNIPIEYVDWELSTISNNIKRFDIGIVPNICQYKNGNFKDQNIKTGIYGTDINIRFKNKSNIGRSLVLIQHGIPVVADITPCNMSLFANPDNGYAVLTEEGWYNALLDLCDYNKRNQISQNAFNEYKLQYDPLKWSYKLYKNIEKLYYERFN